MYRLDASAFTPLQDDPAAVMAQVAAERKERKQQHAA
jgi:hypothetical protein